MIMYVAIYVPGAQQCASTDTTDIYYYGSCTIVIP